MSAEALLPAVGQGRLLVRLKLRQLRRQTTDPVQQKAIDAALADPDFVDNLTDEGLSQAGGTLPPFLQWLLTNLPQILALILALFGGA